jgi:hypothetical protein
MFKKSLIITILIVLLSGGILVYASFLDKEEPVKPVNNISSNNISEIDNNNGDNQNQDKIEDDDIPEVDTSSWRVYQIEEKKFDMSSKLLGDRIYFFNNEDKMVEWVDFEGNIHKLVFTEMDGYIYSNDFIISSDDQKIVWVETNTWDETVKMNSKLMLADLDGQNKKVLLEKKFDGEKYLKPIRWSNSGEEIYFTEQRGGLGGYIIFDGPTNLSKINIITGQIEHLFDGKKITKDPSYIGNISPNEEFISYFIVKGNNPKLIIRNIKTGKENIFNIPLEEGFSGGGDAYFSPDNKHLVYNIAHWDPNDEYYRVVVASSIKKEQKTIIDDYGVIGWVSNDKILLRNFDGIYIIDIDGSNLKKIEIVNS